MENRINAAVHEVKNAASYICDSIKNSGPPSTQTFLMLLIPGALGHDAELNNGTIWTSPKFIGITSTAVFLTLVTISALGYCAYKNRTTPQGTFSIIDESEVKTSLLNNDDDSKSVTFSEMNTPTRRESSSEEDAFAVKTNGLHLSFDGDSDEASEDLYKRLQTLSDSAEPFSEESEQSTSTSFPLRKNEAHG
jgi:hypothetical protein